MESARALTIGILTAAVVLTPVGAGALPTASSEPAVNETAAMVASNDAVSYERAATIVDAQDEFLQLASDLESSETTFAGAAIEPDSDHDGWLSFVGTPSAAALERIEAASLTIDVRTDAEFTAAQLAATLRETHAALEAQDGVGGAAGYLDVESQELIFAAWPDEATASASARSEAPDLVIEDFGPNIEVTVVPEAVVSDEIDGGRHLSNGCTSAFNVRDGSGRKGFLTAAHCGNGVSGNAFVAEREAAGVDVQLHRASSVTNRIRYTTGGATRIISNWSYPRSGASACNYGSATGNKCTTIYSNDVCWPGLGCGFYATNEGVTSGGDSGGPWYSGSSAFGVHKGTMWLFGNKSVFTDMGNALGAMGVSLCTTSAC